NKKVREINKLLKSNKLLREDIVRELDEIKEEYGSVRTTKVLKRAENWEVDEADLIEDETVYVGVSKKGYIKRSSKRSFKSTEKVGVGNDDEHIFEAECSTKDILYVFTDNGKYYRLPVYAVDEYRWGENGKYLGSIGDMKTDEVVINTFIEEEKDAESTDKYIL